MIIYLVTHGSYSDYRVDGAFSSRELAKEFINQDSINNMYMSPSDSKYDYCLSCNKENYRIERYELNKKAPVMIHKQTWAATVYIDNGDVVSTGIDFLELFEENQTSKMYNSGGIDKNRRKYITLHSTVSQEHANKLAVEARQAYLREQVKT